MSRYSLKPLPHRSDLFEVAVGWDAGFGTFFVLLFGTPGAEAEPVVCLWRGSTPCEYIHAAEIVTIAARYAEVPDDFASKLELDRLNPGNQSAIF